MEITGKISEVVKLPAGKIAESEQLSAELYAVPGSTEASAYLLVDEDGNEIPAVLVDEETIFTATANDIRLGAIAATEEGVTVGTKDIPAYHTTEGFAVAPVGSECKITIRTADRYNFTKLQAIICPYNTSTANSVAAEKVSIDGSVYDAGKTDVLAVVTVDHDSKSINLGIVNGGTKPYIIRYFTYKEEY